MEHLESPAAEASVVGSVTIRVPALDPAVVLGRASGYPRGFWARGDRWVIHFGVIADFRGRAEAAGPAGSMGVDRCESVWAEAVPFFRRYEELRAPDGEANKPPRVYGGFAFRHDASVARESAEDSLWTHFPPARFVLPAVEVVGKGESSLVTVRAAEGDRAEEDLLDRARSWAEALASNAPERFRTPASMTRGNLRRGSATAREKRREGDPEAWRMAVEEALAWIERGRISKVVLARTLDLLARDDVPSDRVVLNLWRQNPGTHVFLFEPADGCAMVGAAPETVATVSGGVFRATAVAGSISRGEAPEDQEALALKLLESEKDRIEHSIAVEDMVERLRPFAEELGWDAEPHVLTLSGIQHLETRIQARLRAGQNVLSALGALHPTAAVCGLPRPAALDFLRVEERFDRGWYAGPVGWFNSAGDGVFAPALRSAVRAGARWRLFAGAGIVDGSEPGLEWEETRIKFEPVLRAIAEA